MGSLEGYKEDFFGPKAAGAPMSSDRKFQQLDPKSSQTFERGERVGGPKILLIDGSAVIYTLSERVLTAPDDWKHNSKLQLLYKTIVHFFTSLNECGLDLVLILDGGVGLGQEQTWADRRCSRGEENEYIHPLVQSIFMQAFIDMHMGLNVEIGQSAIFSLAIKSVISDQKSFAMSGSLDADRVVFAWYKANESEVCALVTDDSDFYVLGVHRIVHSRHITINGTESRASSVTLSHWETKTYG